MCFIVDIEVKCDSAMWDSLIQDEHKTACHHFSLTKPPMSLNTFNLLNCCGELGSCGVHLSQLEFVLMFL